MCVKPAYIERDTDLVHLTVGACRSLHANHEVNKTSRLDRTRLRTGVAGHDQGSRLWEASDIS